MDGMLGGRMPTPTDTGMEVAPPPPPPPGEEMPNKPLAPPRIGDVGKPPVAVKAARMVGLVGEEAPGVVGFSVTPYTSASDTRAAVGAVVLPTGGSGMFTSAGGASIVPVPSNTRALAASSASRSCVSVAANTASRLATVRAAPTRYSSHAAAAARRSRCVGCGGQIGGGGCGCWWH